MKEKILKAAEEVFSEKGFHEAKVYQIAERAGVAVGSIYRFFKSKEEIYSTIVFEKLNLLKKEVKEAVEDKPPKEALKTYISTVLDFFLKEDRFLQILIKETGTFPAADEERLKLTDWYKNYLNILSSIIEEGIKKGEFKGKNPKVLSLAISGSLKNTVYWYSKGFLKVEPEEVKKEVEDFVLKGILTE